ncbi:MAG: hypothetical protein WD069_17745 [Planctomycetales bacterium]
MKDKVATRQAAATDFAQLKALYLDLLRLVYEEEDRAQAEPVAKRLEAALAESPDFAESIRGEEVRSLIAEVRGDLTTATRSREAELRKILELHALTRGTSAWEAVVERYDFSDVSDRLDLLASLYDRAGDLERAIDTLRESRRFCDAQGVPFDAQDMLDELEQARDAGNSKNGGKLAPAPRRRR